MFRPPPMNGCTCELDLRLCGQLPVLLARVVERHMEDLTHLSTVYPQLEADLTSPLAAGDLLACIWPLANRHLDPEPANLRLARDCNVKLAIGFAITDNLAVVGGGMAPRVARAAALLHALLVLTSKNFALPQQLEDRVRTLGLPPHRPSRPPPLNADALVIGVPMTHDLYEYPLPHERDLLASHGLDLEFITATQALVQLGLELPWIDCDRDSRVPGVCPWFLTAQTAAYRFTYVAERIMDARQGVHRFVLHLAVAGRIKSMWSEVVAGRARPWPVANIRNLPFAKKPANPDPSIVFTYFPCPDYTGNNDMDRLRRSASPRPQSPSSASASAVSTASW